MIAGFEFGCRAPFRVREERVGGPGDGERPWRLLFASDLHLTARRRHLADRLVAVARQLQPDAVLLGGDLVDRRDGVAVLAECAAAIGRCARLAAIPGNHDARAAEAVRGAVTAAGGVWLPDGGVTLEAADRRPARLDARVATGEPGTRRVLVAHHPEAVVAAAAAGYDAVLAGHLHGGQCVLWSRGQLLYPGALFSRWNGLRFAVGDTTMLVSCGLADTLPVRFRCPREVVLCLLH